MSDQRHKPSLKRGQAPGTAATKDTTHKTAPPALNLGPYQLLKPIGKGGMATVWRARHRTLHRKLAIKMLDREAKGP